MKIFQNKFFLICLCIALVLCTVSSTFSLMGYREPIREVIGVVATPFQWGATIVTDAVSGFFRHFQLQGALIDRNEELEEELSRLEEQRIYAEMLEEENKRLRDYLGMKDRYAGYHFEEARIIGSEASDYKTVFTLNRGSAHGISTDMAVVVSAGVVGKVTEVGLTWCKVTTILEKSTDANGIGGIISETGVQGVVRGDYELSLQGLCKMTYISGSQQIKAGDVVRSIGDASIYPPDLLIGVVEEVTMDEYTRTVVATVRPAVDFSSLDYVLIVINPDVGGA